MLRMPKKQKKSNMCEKNCIKLKNLKISLVTKKPVFENEIGLIIKFHKKLENKLAITVRSKGKNLKFTTDIANFENISGSGLVVTIYPKCKQLLNITGIKCFSDVTSVVKLVKDFFECEIEKINCDCAFYSIRNFGNYRLNAIYEILKKKLKNKIVEYNPEQFAAIVVKNRVKNIPLTSLIFRTGSVCILGKIVETDAEKLYNSIALVLKSYG